MPWSLALLRAQKELESKWDQRRDFLTLRSVNRTLKGDGRGRGAGQNIGGKGSRDRGGDVKVEPGKKRYETDMAQPGASPSLKLREASSASQQKSSQFSTCTHYWGKPLCKNWNDGRGCKKQGGGCKFNREHRCDIRLQGTGEACGGRDHNRESHDARRHGLPSNKI